MPHKDPEQRKLYHKQYREAHKKRIAEYQEQYRKLHDYSEYKAEWYKDKRFNRYGITKQDYTTMLEQQKHSCKICFQQFSESVRPAIDHCHTTKKVRGLLCIKCNLGIGHFNDSPTLLHNAIVYLDGEGND